MKTALRVALPLLAVLASGCPSKEGGGDEDVWVGNGPARMLLDGDIAWITNAAGNTIDAIDLTTCADGCETVATVQLETGAAPFDGVVVPSLNRLFVVKSSFENPGVVEIDTQTQEVVATIEEGLVTPQSVAYGGGALYVADSNGYGFGPGFVAELSGGAVVGSAQTTQLQPSAFAVLPNGDIAVTNVGYVTFDPVAATSSGGIDILDPDTGAIVDNVDMGLTAPISRLAVHGDYGYTASGVSGTLLRVNLQNGDVDGWDIAPAGTFLTGTFVEDGRLFVLSSNEDRIYVFDAETAAPIEVDGTNTYLTVGPGGDTPRGPNHAAVWEDADGVKHMFVVMGLSNSIVDVVLDEVFPE